MAAVNIHSDFGAPKRKSVNVFTFSPSICHEVIGLDFLILVFWMLSLKPAFSLSSFTFIKRPFSSSLVSAKGWCHLHIWGDWYFSWKSLFQPVLHLVQHFSWCTLHISYINRVTIYILDVLLFLFGTSLLFHIQFWLLLPDLHIGFSGGSSGGLVFPSPSEFSTAYCDPHSQLLCSTINVNLSYSRNYLFICKK